MAHQRRTGVLCHPTSLPSAYGIGDLGEGARCFIAYLAAAGQNIWQILPLGPTGYGDSPYQPFSAFACNPLLISPDQLAADGLFSPDELAMCLGLPDDYVDYGQVIERKTNLLRYSFKRFIANPAFREELDKYRYENSAWLEDYAVFMTLKRRLNWASWVDWPTELALHTPDALAEIRQTMGEEISFHCYLQFEFSRQWSAIREQAHAAGISLIGDMPIFVGHDSADVWAHRELFVLDGNGRPLAVAGVPPDYFSPTGQLWGNPLYRWDRLYQEGYGWWIERLRHVLTTVDQVRLDHFRGFAGYWAVPAGESTAINGRWVQGPGRDFFKRVHDVLGQLPIIAEDLGLISADVITLRKELGLPGMRVLQFAFDSDAHNDHLPHNWEPELVVYTGTHDNDTTVGWFSQLSPEVRARVENYLGSREPINWALIRLALNSVAETVIVPFQDVLGCGSDCRLNSPGKPSGNWTWRFKPEVLRDDLAAKLRELTVLSGRYLEPGQEPYQEQPVVITYQELGL